MPTLLPPVRYTPDLEDVQPGEGETVQGLNETFDTIIETTAEDYGHAVRGVHAKSHGILRGVLRIRPDLPEELAQGMFARGGDHPVYLRLSTNAGDILPDAVSLPRGLALKVLQVDGERLPGADGATQDFVMVNGTVFQAKTASEFHSSLKLLAGTTDRLEGTKKAMSSVLRGVNSALQTVGIQSPTVNALGGAPQVDPLGETYYSVTPFRYGDYVAKFSLAPVSADLKALCGETIAVDGREDAIREIVREEMRKVTATWELRVQLLRDRAAQPVEDPTVEWSEDVSPFETVATVEVRPQDSWDEELVQEVNEGMRFSVWTGLAAHRPLGNINRARRDTYRHSAAFRQVFNKCPIHEPGAR
ncbi:catalase family protein [Jiella sp. M17.18]|uniref:catalase family protein n=1 Tax=Jiella sp. M17.18 TaxID=3234247 RepID=UPI0034DEE77F